MSQKLTALAPTAEEVAAARALLEHNKKSKMASMVHWLRANPDPAIANSRGEQRQKYLEQWMIWSMRSKKAKTSSTNEQVTSVENSAFSDWHWCSVETMDTKLGP